MAETKDWQDPAFGLQAGVAGFALSMSCNAAFSALITMLASKGLLNRDQLGRISAAWQKPMNAKQVEGNQLLADLVVQHDEFMAGLVALLDKH